LGRNEFRNLDKYVGLLAHTGFGLDFLKTEDRYISKTMGNFIAGVTGQIKLSERVAKGISQQPSAVLIKLASI
jgi:hypothetical protein